MRQPRTLVFDRDPVQGRGDAAAHALVAQLEEQRVSTPRAGVRIVSRAFSSIKTAARGITPRNGLQSTADGLSVTGPFLLLPPSPLFGPLEYRLSE